MKNFYMRLSAALAGFAIFYGLSTVHADAYSKYVPKGDGGPTETTNGPTNPNGHVQWYPCASNAATATYPVDENHNFSNTHGVFCANAGLPAAQPFGGYQCKILDPGNNNNIYTGWCLGVQEQPCPQDNAGSNTIKTFAGEYYLTVSDQNINNNKYLAYIAGGIVNITNNGDIVFTLAGNNNAPLQYYDNIGQVIQGRTQGNFTDLIQTATPGKLGEQIRWQDKGNKSVSLTGTLSCGNPTQVDGKWSDIDNSNHGGVFNLTRTYPTFP